MNTENYLNRICLSIQDKSKRDYIIEELRDNMEDDKNFLLKKGFSESEAEIKSIENMGEVEEVAEAFNHVYKPIFEKAQIITVAAVGALSSAVAHVGNINALAEVPRNIAAVIGIALYLYAFVLFLLEVLNDVPFFYNYAKNWGTVFMNGAVIAGISIGAFYTDPIKSAIYIIITIFLMTLERYSVRHHLFIREQQYILKEGRIVKMKNNFGKAVFGDKKLSVYSPDNLSKGTRIVCIGSMGSKLIVESL